MEMMTGTTEEGPAWDTAREHAKALHEALIDWAYIEGSCNGDWSERAVKLQSLAELAERLEKQIDDIRGKLHVVRNDEAKP
jgi:hypothetical protein